MNRSRAGKDALQEGSPSAAENGQAAAQIRRSAELAHDPPRVPEDILGGDQPENHIRPRDRLCRLAEQDVPSPRLIPAGIETPPDAPVIVLFQSKHSGAPTPGALLRLPARLCGS